MRIDILTIFPAMFAGPFAYGAVGRAVARGLLTVAPLDMESPFSRRNTYFAQAFAFSERELHPDVRNGDEISPDRTPAGGSAPR